MTKEIKYDVSKHVSNMFQRLDDFLNIKVHLYTRQQVSEGHLDLQTQMLTICTDVGGSINLSLPVFSRVIL